MIVKLSRIAILVLSVVSILSVGCAPVQPPPAENQSYTVTEDGYTLTDDGLYTSAPEDHSPASQRPPITRNLRRLSWEAGPEVYYFKYKEAGFMEEEGTFYGANLAFTLRNWLPASPEQSSQAMEAMDMAFQKWMLRGEARFALGEVDYKAPPDAPTITLDNLDDRTFEVRLLAGPDFPTGNTMFTLFTGVGFRYLHDDLRGSAVDAGGYERESQYLYLPLGATVISQLGSGWHLGLSAEFDLFLYGRQRSHIPFIWEEIIEPGTPPVVILHYEEFIDNYQQRGYGLRASARLEKKGDKVDFIIEPFVRYWDINESDTDIFILGLEPTNSTYEAGVRVMFGF